MPFISNIHGAYHTDDLTQAQYARYCEINKTDCGSARKYAIDCIRRNFSKEKFPEEDEL